MRFFTVCSVVLMSMGMTAECRSQAAVYAEFTGVKLSSANTPWLFGPTVGLYYDYGHGVISTGFDVRGSFLRRGNFNGSTTDLELGLIGVRLAATPHVLPIKPYVEVLGGIGHMQSGVGSTAISAKVFTYELLGGVDFTFLPRLDWRVVEFSYGGLAVAGQSFSPKSLSTGLVFRLP